MVLKPITLRRKLGLPNPEMRTLCLAQKMFRGTLRDQMKFQPSTWSKVRSLFPFQYRWKLKIDQVTLHSEGDFVCLMLGVRLETQQVFLWRQRIVWNNVQGGGKLFGFLQTSFEAKDESEMAKLPVTMNVDISCGFFQTMHVLPRQKGCFLECVSKRPILAGQEK